MNQLHAVTGRPARVALAAVIALSLMLVPGLGPSSGALAQEPEISAGAITYNVSTNVSINDFQGVSGTKTFNYSRTAKPTLALKISCWGSFTINVATSLAGNVPLTITYLGGRQQSKTMAMAGLKADSFLQNVCLSGAIYTVQPNVPVTGSVTVTPQAGETAVTIVGNGTVSGNAIVSVTGSARLLTYSYLPTIARTDFYFFDDFSSDKGWVNYKCDGGCDCVMERKDDTLQVTLNDSNQRCFVAPPPSVQLSQGNFSVKARKRNDNFVWYGLIFNAGTDLLKKRWALEVRPSDGSPCSSGKGLVWLSYIDGSSTDLWSLCTGSLDLDTNDWNTLQAVRNGDNVKVYLNGDFKSDLEKNQQRLKDEKFFNLEVMSSDEVPVVVQFDDFLLRYN